MNQFLGAGLRPRVSPLCYLQQQGGDFFCLAFDDDPHPLTSSVVSLLPVVI